MSKEEQLEAIAALVADVDGGDELLKVLASINGLNK